MNLHRAADGSHGFNIQSSPTKGLLGMKRSPEQKEKQRKRMILFWSNPDNRKKIEESRSPKRFVLYDPNDNRVEIINLTKFCKENNLSFSKLYPVAIGECVEYKGWKASLNRVDNSVLRFKLKSPEGEIHEGTNLKEFCIKRGLPFNQMYNMLAGRSKHCHRWTNPRGAEEYYRNKSIKTFTLAHKDGREITVTNLTKWCREQKTKCYRANLQSGHSSGGWKIKERHE